MKLSDLKKYNPITIQCHDNPDADAIGAGYALYCYFKACGKDVQLVYSGYSRITKTNLMLMIETLEIPIKYIPMTGEKSVPGLLLTVDCQHGAGNVTALEAEYVAVIDHHPVEIENLEMSRIQSGLGSCSTLVWSMLKEVGFNVDKDENIGTALYYGLYMDTNQFAELFHPLDMDMCEDVTVNKRLMTRYRNANISLNELEIAGIAMIRYNYNDDYRFAVIRSNPCDSNLLGLISDFLLQVAEVDTCAVYNEREDGYKLSVRSCIKEVNANELAAFLTEGIGSGGGHLEKAGGFISKKKYEEKYPTLHSEAYFNNRMTEYFDTFEIIHATDMDVKPEEFTLYRRRKEAICYLRATEIIKPGTTISMRSRAGNMELTVDEGTYIIMERDGSLQIMTQESFDGWMEEASQPVQADYYKEMEYVPVIKNLENGSSYLLSDHVRTAFPKAGYCIYIKELDKCVKLFPKWNADKYMVGTLDDYLAVAADDLQNVFVEKGKDFHQRFERIETAEKKGL